MFQIKVPLIRDSLRLIAFGEDEYFHEESCLKRIYPPYAKCQRSAISAEKLKINQSTTDRSKINPHLAHKDEEEGLSTQVKQVHIYYE